MLRKVYAAYGSNLNIEQMKRRCPDAEIIGKGTLKDYKLTFRGKYKGVANVEPFKGRNVPILLWSITEECEASLDRYEGYPYKYIKKSVEITVENEAIEAMIYIIANEHTDIINIPTEEYFNIISDGYRENNMDLEVLSVALGETIKST